MKSYSTFPKLPRLDPHHKTQVNAIFRTLVEGFTLLQKSSRWLITCYFVVIIAGMGGLLESSINDSEETAWIENNQR